MAIDKGFFGICADVAVGVEEAVTVAVTAGEAALDASAEAAAPRVEVADLREVGEGITRVNIKLIPTITAMRTKN